MPREISEHSDANKDLAQQREALQSLFEGICHRTTEAFIEKGEHPPLFLILTRLGLVVVPGDWDPDADKEAIARTIRESICSTAVQTDTGLVYNEPMAVILASEAWMVEADEGESGSDLEYIPPRLHPRRKEILQVTLRSRNVSLSRSYRRGCWQGARPIQSGQGRGRRRAGRLPDVRQRTREGERLVRDRLAGAEGVAKMKELVVHIEFDPDAVPQDWIKDRLDDVLSQAIEGDLGWRFFDSLEEALAWERGERGKELSR